MAKQIHCFYRSDVGSGKQCVCFPTVKKHAMPDSLDGDVDVVNSDQETDTASSGGEVVDEKTASASNFLEDHAALRTLASIACSEPRSRNCVVASNVSSAPAPEEGAGAGNSQSAGTREGSLSESNVFEGDTSQLNNGPATVSQLDHNSKLGGSPRHGRQLDLQVSNLLDDMIDVLHRDSDKISEVTFPLPSTRAGMNEPIEPPVLPTMVTEEMHVDTPDMWDIADTAEISLEQFDLTSLVTDRSLEQMVEQASATTATPPLSNIAQELSALNSIIQQRSGAIASNVLAPPTTSSLRLSPMRQNSQQDVSGSNLDVTSMMDIPELNALMDSPEISAMLNSPEISELLQNLPGVEGSISDLETSPIKASPIRPRGTTQQGAQWRPQSAAAARNLSSMFVPPWRRGIRERPWKLVRLPPIEKPHLRENRKPRRLWENEVDESELKAAKKRKVRDTKETAGRGRGRRKQKLMVMADSQADSDTDEDVHVDEDATSGLLLQQTGQPAEPVVRQKRKYTKRKFKDAGGSTGTEKEAKVKKYKVKKIPVSPQFDYFSMLPLHMKDHVYTTTGGPLLSYMSTPMVREHDYAKEILVDKTPDMYSVSYYVSKSAARSRPFGHQRSGFIPRQKEIDRERMSKETKVEHKTTNEEKKAQRRERKLKKQQAELLAKLKQLEKIKKRQVGICSKVKNQFFIFILRL